MPHVTARAVVAALVVGLLGPFPAAAATAAVTDVSGSQTAAATQPPGPVTGLYGYGGDYEVTAFWTLPTDLDLASLTLTLTDATTGKTSTVVKTPTATTHSWGSLPGSRSYTVSVRVTDTSGLVSNVATTTVQTNPDTNGPPPPINVAQVGWTAQSSNAVLVYFYPPSTLPVDFAGFGYAIVPMGQDPESFTTTYPLPFSNLSTLVSKTIQLPARDTSFQLVLLVWDFNGNRSASVLTVAGATKPFELPSPATNLSVTSPFDNILDVMWANPVGGAARTAWTVTAVSGDLSLTQVLSPDIWNTRFYWLAGHRDWTVTVTGTNSLGARPGVTAAPVTVAGVGPPPPATNARRTPVYDSEVLRWTNPLSADFDHVEVTRRGATPAETAVIYRGRVGLARAVGLVPGRSYSFEIATFDRLGHTAVPPVTVTTVQSSVTLAGATSAAAGATIPLSGVLDRNGTPIADRAVTIQSLPAGASIWRTVAAATTTPSGTFTTSVHPVVTTRYRAAYIGSAGMGGCYSPVSTVQVLGSAGAPAKRAAAARGPW